MAAQADEDSVLLCLASLTEHCVLKVCQHCSECQCFTPFHGWVIFYCVDGPHCVYLFSVYLLMVIWVVSTFWLLWIMLLWTCMYKCLCGPVFSFLLGLYVGVELLGLVVTPCLTFWGTTRLSSKTVAPLHIPTSAVWRFQFLPFFIVCLWDSSTLVGMKCYVMGVLSTHQTLTPFIPGTL